MVFTDRQGMLRWLFLGAAAGVFIFCQFFIEYELGPHQFSSNTRSILFSVNVVGTGALLYGLAAIAHLRGREAQAEARAATARAEYLANTDALTGLMNRRPVMLEFDRLDRLESGSFCYGISDLDAFKDLNDTYGHGCGDRVLAAVGRAFRTHVRVTDIVGRWGGEEFIFILHDTTLADAVKLMERLRTEVEGLTIPCGDHSHTTTASFGVADGEGGSPSFRVVKRADDAMYDAKAAGRNAVRSRPLAAGDNPAPVVDASTRSLRVRGTEK
jgi:diguanylate cyclase (GGDEF)-like protein